MFNLGIGELTVIAVILIVAVGPDRLPTLMKTVGKTLRAVRQASRDIRTSVGIDEMMREDVLAPPRPRYQPPPSTVARAPGSALPEGEAGEAGAAEGTKADAKSAAAQGESGTDAKSANAAPDAKAQLAAGVQAQADTLLSADPAPATPAEPSRPASATSPSADEGPKSDG